MERRIVPTKEWLTVDKKGNTYNTKTGYKYKDQYDKYGYIKVSTRFMGKIVKCFAHRAVALAFIPNPDNKPTVNHKNGIKDDNRVENLEWSTLSEQQLHAHATGLKPNKVIGEDSHFCVYGEQVAREVCKLIEEGHRNKDILNLYPEMDVKLPSDIRTGKSWKHLSCDYNFSHNRRVRLSTETVKWVCSKLEEGLTSTQIVKMSNNSAITTRVVDKILNKETYTKVSKEYNF